MATLTTTSRGQITLRKEVFRHLGIDPGAQLELSLSPGGNVTLSAKRPAGSIEDFLGCLAGRTSKVATIEEMNDAIADAAAGLR